MSDSELSDLDPQAEPKPTPQECIAEMAILIDGLVGMMLNSADYCDFSLSRLYEIRDRANAVCRVMREPTEEAD